VRLRTFSLSTVRGLIASGLVAGVVLAVGLIGWRLVLLSRGVIEKMPDEPEATSAAVEPQPELRERSLLIPVQGVVPAALRDNFNDARGGGKRVHHALDIMAARGTPVLAVEDGRIVRLHKGGAGGITVYQLDGSGRYGYYYAHLDQYADGLKRRRTRRTCTSRSTRWRTRSGPGAAAPSILIRSGVDCSDATHFIEGAFAWGRRSKKCVSRSCPHCLRVANVGVGRRKAGLFSPSHSTGEMGNRGEACALQRPSPNLNELPEGGTTMWRSLTLATLSFVFCDSIPSAYATSSAEDSSLLILGQDAGRAATLNGRAFVVVDDGVHGEELWVGDGTSPGFVLLRDIHPGLAGSGVSALTVLHDRLYFSADDGVNGQELWRTDGTHAGTVLVADINPGPESSTPVSLRAIGGLVYFSAFRPATGREPWKSDGTLAGTAMIADVRPGTLPSDPSEFTPLGGKVLFSAEGSVTTGKGRKSSTTSMGRELWSTDGTASGTALVKDIYAGFNSSNPGAFVPLRQAIFFAAFTAEHGQELWRTDGTRAGTVLVKDIVPGTSSSFVTRLRVHDERLFFNANAGGGLWRSDGTPQGTVPAVDLAPGVDGLIAADFKVLGSRLVFTAASQDGVGLWATDGTSTGTQFLQLLVGNEDALQEVRLASVVTGDRLFYVAHDPAIGTELHATDGTPSGTALVRDIHPDQGNPFVPPLLVVDLSGRLLFVANESISGWELWLSDGTASGTLIVHDFLPDF
jgi:ELWxxDGT repeat protein